MYERVHPATLTVEKDIEDQLIISECKCYRKEGPVILIPSTYPCKSPHKNALVLS